MAKRIVKKIFKEGDHKLTMYVVETNRLLTFIPAKWHTITYVKNPRALFENREKRKAMFYSFQEACEFVGGEVAEIVEQEIKL